MAGRAAGIVAPRLQISFKYAPSSLLAIRSAALAIPSRPIFEKNTLKAGKSREMRVFFSRLMRENFAQ